MCVCVWFFSAEHFQNISKQNFVTTLSFGNAIYASVADERYLMATQVCDYTYTTTCDNTFAQLQLHTSTCIIVVAQSNGGLSFCQYDEAQLSRWVGVCALVVVGGGVLLLAEQIACNLCLIYRKRICFKLSVLRRSMKRPDIFSLSPGVRLNDVCLNCRFETNYVCVCVCSAKLLKTLVMQHNGIVFSYITLSVCQSENVVPKRQAVKFFVIPSWRTENATQSSALTLIHTYTYASSVCVYVGLSFVFPL